MSSDISSPTRVSPRTTTVFMLHKWYSKSSEIKYQIYADNSLLYRNINSEEDIHILQEDLNALVLWANKF